MIVPVPQFTAPSYMDMTRNEVQRCVNLYPQQTSDGWKLVSTPGWNLFCAVDASNGVRGLYYSSTGKLFCAANTTLYEISDVGVKTSRGTIASGTEQVFMADNGTDLLIVISETNNRYSLVMAAGSVASIADTNFPNGAIHCAFQDGYFIVIAGSQFYLSALLSATDWTPLTFATAEAAGDTLVAVYSDGQYIHVIGKQTKETWYNTGNASFPFERVNGATHSIGAHRCSWTCFIDGAVYIFGSATCGRGSVWEVRGTAARRISTPYIQVLLERFDSGTTWTLGMKYGGERFFIISSSAQAKSIAYNANTETWFELSGNASASDYYRLRLVSNAFDVTYGGIVAALNGSPGDLVSVGQLASSNENSETSTGITSQNIIRRRIFGPIRSDSRVVFHSQIRIEFEADYDATGATSISASLDWTDDGGLTYSTAITLTKTVTNSSTSQRGTLIANRLGRSSERYYRVTFTGPAAKLILTKCELDLREGRF